MTPRLVTGAGILSAFGAGREAFERGLAAAIPPARSASLAAFDTTRCPEAPSRVAEVPGFDPTITLGEKGLRSLDRQTKLLVVAARECVHDAGLKKDGAFVALSPERVGLVASNAYGSLEAVAELDRVAVLEDARYINPAKFPNTVANSASGYVSIWEDLRALNVSVSDGNAGGLDAFVCADVYLETGRADAIVTGGGEALSEPLYVGWERLGALTRETLLAEGAALFCVETRESAVARGARAQGHLLGAASVTASPPRPGVLLHASPEAMDRAVRDALADAGVSAADVSLVASGVSQPGRFGSAELDGITRALGASVPITAPKQLLGETLGAGGALGVAAALAWLGGAKVTTLIRGAAPGSVKTVVVTSLGYYGNAAAVVLGRA